MNKSTRIILGLLIIIAAIASVYFYDKDGNSPETIKIGVLMPMSGDLGVFGEKVKKGVDIAVKNYPANKIELFYEDTNGFDNAGAVTAYHKLADIDHINVLIGPFGPEQMLAIAGLAKKNGVTVFGISLCDDRLKEYDNLFCTYPSNRDQVLAAVPEIKKLGLKKLFLVTQKSELGDIISQSLKEGSVLGGYQFVGEERTSGNNNTDFRNAIVKAKSAHPDVIFSTLPPSEGHIFLKQLRELGYQGASFTQLDTTEEKMRSFGTVMEGTYLPGHIDENFEENFTKAYAVEYKNEKPDMYAALGHSAAELVLDTLKKNNWGLDKLQEKVVEQTDGKTAIKDFGFRKDHTVSIPLQTLIFKDGKIQTL